MNTTMKRVLSLLLCFVLATSCLPVCAFATETGETAATVATEATEPSTEATEPSTEATEPSTEATEPSTEATEPVVIAVTGITLDQTAVEVGVGELPMTLTATVLPEDATDKTVTWISSEPGVVSVENGALTFGYMGTATITATAGDFSATCTVTVGEGEWDTWEGGTVVIAGSDFQNTANSHSEGAEYVTTLLKKIVDAGYTNADGFLFAGDYDYGYDDPANGKAALQSAVQAVYGTNMHEVYVEGNHDSKNFNLVGTTLSASGNNDAKAYGVYVIHESDYMWYNNDETTIKTTAAKLDAYLDAKVAEKYDQPIFVISHLPLHYSMRTYYDGDGMYANYIFDVLNEAGAAGLNIIFLFGHNHSNGWDDYLGGAAIYLKKGDSINIAQASRTNFDVETLNFHYMNAGYVSYYRNVNTGSETDLTMTVFEITDDTVKVSRFSENGLHDMKSSGVTNSHKNESAYSPDTTAYKSPQTITLSKFVPDATITKDGVSVTAPGITDLTVFSETKTVDGYTAYLAYDITPENYVQGNTATVTVPVTDAFDESKSVVVLDQGKVIATTNIVNHTVTFTTNHFSLYEVAQMDESAGASASGNLATSSVTQITSFADLKENVGYLIVAGEGDDITLTNQTNGDGLLLNGSVSADNTHLWYLDLANEYIRYGSTTGEDNYLKVTKGGASVGNSKNRVTEIYENGDGTFALYRSSYYLNRYGGSSSTKAAGWTENNSGSKWKLYEVAKGDGSAVTLTVNPASKSLITGNVANLTASVLVAGASADSYTINWSSSDENVATVDTNGMVTAVADGTVNITATLTGANGQNVNGTVSVQIPVTVTTRTATSIEVSPMTGTVQRGSGLTTETGSTMKVTYSDGATDEISLTLAMLEGNYTVTENGTYTGLTVRYGGKTIEGYTLNVVNVAGNDFPKYPNPGSVQVDKSAKGVDFQNTGLARVELSTSGLPAGQGVDVVIVIDTSASMDTTVDGKTRIKVLSESLEDMLEQFKKANATTGQIPDVDIAIIDFNGYYDSSAGDYDKISLTNSYRSNVDYAKVFTGTNAGSYIKNVGLSADNFVDSTSITPSVIAGQFTVANTMSGTNYDGALENAYKLLAAKKAANGTTHREQYVIFLSDGAPFRYNGFNNGSTASTYATWNRWLTGEWTNEEALLNAYPNLNYSYFYNGNGTNHPHRIAEAIKGNENNTYDVVVREAANNNPAYIEQYQGLGAKIYSIGFCLAADKDVTEDTERELIRTISSGAGYYYENITSATQLKEAFTQIVTSISYAATNAVFEDQMGSAFDLQMNPTVKTNAGGNGTTTTNVDTSITVTSQNVYTSSNAPTTDDVGKVYGTATAIETVTFTNDDSGNIIATSTVKKEADGNILNDGVICASTFFYNTTSEIKTITLANGSTYQLPAETFYWNIGTINEKQYTLSYMVYLTGAMEGKCSAGSYDTNNYATLSYTNWLGNDVEQSVPSPSMPWGGANVSYAFYLVDENGNPLLQNGDQAANFLTAYKVTQPVLYKTINLNAGETVLSAIGKDVLPDGYELYDENAAYTVTIQSGDGDSNWSIASTTDVQSTYVIGYAGAQDYSNAANVHENSYDYTHTTVYFAVKWVIGTVPDTVVIDYGLPVDISVLANDMFGGNGTLVAVGPRTTTVRNEELLGGFKSTHDGTHGNATVSGDKVRYQLDEMDMNGSEKFSYAVSYNVTDKDIMQYYYGTVTVIPATTIYYEDNFLNLTSYTKSGDTWTEDSTTKWSQGISTGTQDEDRPGEYSLSEIDANNIYGFDAANQGMATHSLNNAAKITVDASTRGEATFTFYGTGFDVISTTSNTTGTLTVQVYQGATVTDEAYKTSVVDTYYGMNKDGNISLNSPEAIYQVPVMKISGLTYGQYTVKITAGYSSIFDHDGGGSYELYLDAIRIYDPAGTSYGEDGDIDQEIQDAYIEDGEAWPVYTEMRNNIISAKGVTTTTDAEGNVTVTFPEGADLNGAIFIDCNDGTTSIQDYVSYGPNNELYLAPNQAIAFNINVPTNVADIQLGIKVANGDSVTYTINGEQKTVSTTTDMYYSILNYAKSGTVTIKNTSGGILSLTNIKVTHTSDPYAVSNASLLWMDGESAGAALMSLRPVAEEETPEETIPETTVPEETEPEATEPEVTEPETTEPETEPTEPETEPTEPTVEEVVESVKEFVKKLFGWLFG